MGSLPYLRAAEIVVIVNVMRIKMYLLRVRIGRTMLDSVDSPNDLFKPYRGIPLKGLLNLLRICQVCGFITEFSS